MISPTSDELPTYSRDFSSVNSGFHFQNWLSHRSLPQPSSEYMQKPRWGHSAFRGQLFSRPDHISEVKRNKDAYRTVLRKTYSKRPVSAKVHRSKIKMHKKSGDVYMYGRKDVNSSNANLYFTHSLRSSSPPPTVKSHTSKKNTISKDSHWSAASAKSAHFEEIARKGQIRYMSSRKKRIRMPKHTLDTSPDSEHFQRERVSSGSSNHSVNHIDNLSPEPEISNVQADEKLLEEADAYAASGLAPPPSEIISRLAVQHSHLQDLTVWANDAGVFHVRCYLHASLCLFLVISNRIERFCSHYLSHRTPW